MLLKMRLILVLHSKIILKSISACTHKYMCECVWWASSHGAVWKHACLCLPVSWNSFWVKTNWCSCRRGWGQIMTTSARSTQAWTGRHHRPTPLHRHMDRRDKDNKSEEKEDRWEARKELRRSFFYKITHLHVVNKYKVPWDAVRRSPFLM